VFLVLLYVLCVLLETQKQKWLNETLAVIVLYQSELKDSPTFISLTQSLEAADAQLDLIVFNNSPTAGAALDNPRWKIFYRHNPTNMGVSKMYNEGHKQALSQGKKWLLLLDQDTRYPVSFFSDCGMALQQHPNEQIFIPRLYDAYGMVSPFTFRFGGGQRIPPLKPGSYSIKKYKFQNCGVLISLEAFGKAGGYDNGLPLDFSDYSFVDRLEKVLANVVVTQVTAQHSFSSTSHASLTDSVARFKYYVKGCRYYKKYYKPNDWTISVRLLLRSIKLSGQYKSWKFMLIYFNREA
jgi:rhamnosyltransferase